MRFFIWTMIPRFLFINDFLSLYHSYTESLYIDLGSVTRLKMTVVPLKMTVV
jgi:hypothetical protein